MIYDMYEENLTSHAMFIMLSYQVQMIGNQVKINLQGEKICDLVMHTARHRQPHVFWEIS